MPPERPPRKDVGKPNGTFFKRAGDRVTLTKLYHSHPQVAKSAMIPSQEVGKSGENPVELTEFLLDNPLPFQQFPPPNQSGSNQTKDF